MWQKISFNRFCNGLGGRREKFGMANFHYAISTTGCYCSLISILKCRSFICNKVSLVLKSFEKLPEICLLIYFCYKSCMKILQRTCAILGCHNSENLFPEFSGVFSLPIFQYKSRALKSAQTWLHSPSFTFEINSQF